MKRLLREAVRHLLPLVAVGHDAVLVVRSEFDAGSITEVESLVKALFQKVNLIAGQHEIRNS